MSQTGQGREPLIAEPPSWMPKMLTTLGLKPVAVIVAAAVTGIVTTAVVGTWVWRSTTIGAGVQDKMLLTDTAKLDHRQYQWAKINSGLEVVNVQDVTSTSGGFAVAVEAGSFYDPKDLQGLAHFCEHMLFLGTAKYPNPSGFDQFLNTHGGANNAYTAEEVTVYFAQLDIAGFSEGLDRFSDFFRAPLFDETYVKREVHAIDSEHAKNKQSPDWRILQVMQSLADPRSPVAGFHTGNLKTLYDEPMAKGINPVDALKKYYAENYCTPKLRLVTFGPKSVDDQLKESIEKFGDIQQGPNCQASPKSFAEPAAFPKSSLQKWVHIQGTSPMPQLWVFWSLPDLQKQYPAHPMRYLKYVLGYTGVNSLSETLKNNLGLTTDIDVAADMSSAGTNFWIVLSLTSKGAKYPEVVMDTLYSYIAQVKRNGVDEKLYSSLADLTKLEWEWSEESDTIATVQSLAEQMTRLPKEDLLTGDYLIKNPDPIIVKDMVNKLKPENMNVAFVDPNFDETDVMELPHYGVKYTVQDLEKQMPVSKEWASWVHGASKTEVDKAMVRRLQAMDDKIKKEPNIKHPEPIKHIPRDITLSFAKAPPGQNEISALYGAEPVKLKTKSSQEQIWYRQGSTSESPKVHMKFLTRRKGHRTINADEVIIHTLWRRMIGEQLHPKVVDLAATGTSYSIDVGSHSLSVSFGGFQDNLPAMMDLVTDEMRSGVDISNTERFSRNWETLAKELEDKSEMPVQYAIEDRSIMLMQGTHSDVELRAAMNNVKPEKLEKPSLAGIEAKPTQFTALAMGNIPEEKAMSTTQKYLSAMNFNTSLADSDTEIVTAVVHPKAPLELRKLNPRANDPNHVTVVSLLAGVPDVIDSVVWSIIGQVLGPVAYDELRTRKQLGYVVSGGVGKLSNVLVLNVVVQGKEMQPDETEAAIDMVLTKLMPERLLAMTTEEFESYKEATAKAFLKPPLGFSDEISQYWPSVAALGQCFEKRHDELEYLRNNLKNKQQLVDAYMNVILPKNKAVRSRVVVKYWSQDVEGGVPARPDFKKRKAMLEEAGVPAEGIQQAQAEHKETEVLDTADSRIRSGLARKYGHFSSELKCRKSAQKEEAIQETEQSVDDSVRQQDDQEQSAESDAAKVAVSSHVQQDSSQVAMEEGEGAAAHSSKRKKKKLADSAMAIDHAARLSVDQVVRGED
eukprot:gnl/MRDRNA2_/MRDRNA2_97964_c0_seq1.p1 gnl/MRDRNA2_/MRDRNA2_97964_c0~~gnl/MRDRNA2_/MRDRNA2_97964_c0_seq1.p1  ORF type:complete len:1184 (+),score=293.62 gnl/MRDRNA2_/MRDRNA2_97964_c0_seq1:176-3727(+)